MARRWYIFPSGHFRNHYASCSREDRAWVWKPTSTSALLCVFVTQSGPTLCDPIDHSPRGSSVHGILQARILPSSRGSSWHTDRTHISYVSSIHRWVPVPPNALLYRKQLSLSKYTNNTAGEQQLQFPLQEEAYSLRQPKSSFSDHWRSGALLGPQAP